MKMMKVVTTGGAGRKFLKRGMVVVGVVGIYCLSTVGIVTTTGVTSAEARNHGGRGVSRAFVAGGNRGFVRGGGRRVVRGGGRYYGGYYGGYYPGYYSYYDDGCYWSRRYGRWICPYGY
jgi:hypothetical protein